VKVKEGRRLRAEAVVLGATSAALILRVQVNVLAGSRARGPSRWPSVPVHEFTCLLESVLLEPSELLSIETGLVKRALAIDSEAEGRVGLLLLPDTRARPWPGCPLGETRAQP
jgi:hypothetical protein